MDPHCFIYTGLISVHNGIVVLVGNKRLVKKYLVFILFIYLNSI